MQYKTIPLLCALAMFGCDDASDSSEESAIDDIEVADDDGVLEDEQPEAEHTPDDDQGEGTPQAPQLDLAGAVGPLANHTSDLSTCRWKKVASSSAVTVRAACAPWESPISGGCWNSSHSVTIEASHPYEAGNSSGAVNLPDTGDKWYQLVNESGWRCHRSGTSGTLSALALCCGSILE